MNIESTTLSSIAPSNVIVENVSAPPVNGVVVSEGFSEALVAQIAQIELLSNMKAEDSMPLQTPEQAVLPSVNNSPSAAEVPVSKIDAQDFAALLGNDLPSSYKTTGDVDHEAALAAVTDTLKYIASGTAVETTATTMAEAGQNIEDEIAMAISDLKNTKDTHVLAVVPTEQNVQNVVEKIVQDVDEKTVQVEQNQPEAAAAVVTANTDIVNTDTVVAEATNTNTDIQGMDELVAAVILSSAIPVEQGKPVNNLTPSNATVTEDELLSFIIPSNEDGKTKQITKSSTDVVNTAAVFRRPDQAKQDFSLKYFENAGQVEKGGHVEQQVGGIEGEKTLPRIGTELVQPNKPVVDNKVDVPAITKPLSHPEWSKDIGERIVWMNNKAIPSAEIRLNPQHLGPISVRVEVTDDKATVAFTAQHAVVRETLEASIPKLREMMSAQQIDLVEVNVSQGSASDQGRSQSQNFAQTSGRGQAMTGGVIDGVDDIEQEIESGRAVVSKGLLSLYA